MKGFKLFAAASVLMLSIGMNAQAPTGENPPMEGNGQDGQYPPRGERPAPPKMKSPEEIAKEVADQMKVEVDLSDKQYKKVYNLIKKDHQYRQSQMENAFNGGMPPQGMPGGMPPGGFPDMGGMHGGFGGGMPGGFGGGMPGGGMPPQAPGMGGPGGPMPGMGPESEIVTEEYLEKQDKKLRKILTEEQYAKWRSTHPAEHQELPPVELSF